MPSKFKIAFFDIDWTLYDHKNRTWSFKSVEAVRGLKSKGIKVVICSARAYDSMEKFGVFELGIDWDGYTASSGAISFVDGKYIRKVLMPEKDARRAYEYLDKRGIFFESIGPKSRFINKAPDEWAEGFYQKFREPVPKIDTYRGQEIVSLNVLCDGSLTMRIASDLSPLRVFEYVPNAIDVMTYPHRKGDGIASFLEYYGISKDEAMGFGDDGYDDVPMAEQVGTFIAMGQAPENLKAVSSFVSAPVWEDGVYQGLKHYGLAD